MGNGGAEVLSCRGVRVRVRPFLRFVQVTGFVVAAWVGFASGAHSLSACLWILAFAAWPAWITYSERRRAGGSITLLPRDLRVQSLGLDRDVARHDVIGGHVVPRTRAVLLRLADGSEVIAELENDDAERVLSHVGMGVGQRVLVAPLGGLIGAFTKGFVATILSLVVGGTFLTWLLGGWGALLALLLTIAVPFVVVGRFGFPRAVVGSDGVRVEGGLRTRFVPFAHIERVTVMPLPQRAIILNCRGGEALHLAMITRSEDEQLALLARIDAGRAAFAPTGEDRVTGLLERGGRSIADWKEAVRRVALADAGFRQQPLRHDDFERVLADPSAPADRRVGAALALRALDDRAAVRIRVAAEGSANERLRVVLEAASEGEVDEDALAEAMSAPRDP